MCRCVYRGIARAIINTLHVHRDSEQSACRLHANTPTPWLRTFVAVEYSYDVEVLARRVLTDVEFLVWDLFLIRNWDAERVTHVARQHLGASYAPKTVTRIASDALIVMGKAAIEVAPYPLYPTREYFDAHQKTFAAAA